MSFLSMVMALGMFVFYFLISYWLFKKLEDKGIFPAVYDIYTGKKKLSVYFEFSRALLFFFVAVLFLFKMTYYAFFVFVFFFFTQFYILKGKVEEAKNTQAIFEIDFKGSYSLEKVILTNDYLYLGKPGMLDFMQLTNKKKIPIYDKTFIYIFLANIYREENELVVQFGFLGLPLLKKKIELPKENVKGADELIHLITKMRKEGPKSKINLELEKKMVRFIMKKAGFSNPKK